MTITARLTLLVGSIAFLVLGVIGVSLYLALERELVRREGEELAQNMDFVRHVLADQSEGYASGAWAHHIDDMVASHGEVHVWITSADGREPVYGATPPPTNVLRDDIGPRAVRLEHPALRAIGERLQATADRPPLDVLVAIDLRPTQQILSEFRLAIVALCLAGVAAMVVLGAWAARHGMRPVARLSAQAHAIGPEALSQRLPAHALPAELVELAQSFNWVLDRLEGSYRQLEAFNADVAHELRTPLSNMIGATEVALSRDREVAELRDVLGSNLEELDHMRAMVNDMLFLARADRSEHATAVETVWLDEVARKVAEFFEPLLDERGVSLRIQGEARVTGDARLLRRALTNLVSNAVAHTEPGGAITVGLSQAGASARLCVRNPGSPISPAHLPRIFDRFYQVDTSRSHGGDRHGLGLAIVNAIVKMHAGAVFASSDQGITEIGFVCPRSPEAAPSRNREH